MNRKWRTWRRPSVWITAAAGMSLLALGAAVAWPWNGLSYWEWEREMRSGHLFYVAKTTRPVIALTFDDGPDPRYTPAVLDILRRHRIHATFFVCGRMVEKNPALALRITVEGHAIGNHTETHGHLERERQSDIDKELDTCQRDIQSATGIRSTLFRPPRGLWNPIVFRDARSNGCDMILWSLAFDRASQTDKSVLARRIVRMARPGDIILMHDGSASRLDERGGTVRELDSMISGLERRGFRFATVPDLLHPATGRQSASLRDR